MEPQEPRSNVIILPTVISKGFKDILEKDLTADEAKNMAIDKLLTMKDTTESVFAMCMDKTTGTPTIIMGGFTDPSFVMMFMELIKDELKELFRSSTMHFSSPDEHTDV